MKAVRLVALCLALGMVAAACGSSSTPSSSKGVSKTGTAQVSLTVGGVESAGYTILPALIAQKEGFFQREGIKADVLYLSSGPAVESALVSDSLNIAFNGSSVVLEDIAKGIDTPIISTMYAKPNWFAAVRDGVPLPHDHAGFPAMLADMAGRPIGATAPGSQIEGLMLLLLHQADLTPQPGQVVTLGSIPAIDAAFRSGNIDFSYCEPPTCEQLASQGIAKIWLPFSADPATADFPTNVWTVNGAFLKSHALTVTRFLKAMALTYAWETNPKNYSRVDQFVEKEYPGLTAAEAAAGTRLVMPDLGLRFTKAQFDAAKVVAEASGATDVAPLRYSQVVWSGSPDIQP
jgi:ABC-type nitrate/sulfonate/bicarbonate transport system substrate-binding protein